MTPAILTEVTDKIRPAKAQSWIDWASESAASAYSKTVAFVADHGGKKVLADVEDEIGAYKKTVDKMVKDGGIAVGIELLGVGVLIGADIATKGRLHESFTRCLEKSARTEWIKSAEELHGIKYLDRRRDPIFRLNSRSKPEIIADENSPTITRITKSSPDSNDFIKATGMKALLDTSAKAHGFIAPPELPGISVSKVKTEVLNSEAGEYKSMVEATDPTFKLGLWTIDAPVGNKTIELLKGRICEPESFVGRVNIDHTEDRFGYYKTSMKMRTENGWLSRTVYGNNDGVTKSIDTALTLKHYKITRHDASGSSVQSLYGSLSPVHIFLRWAEGWNRTSLQCNFSGALSQELLAEHLKTDSALAAKLLFH